MFSCEFCKGFTEHFFYIYSGKYSWQLEMFFIIFSKFYLILTLNNFLTIF